MTNQLLLLSGLVLVIVGFLVIIITMLYLAKTSASKIDVKGGGIIMIGPFPIILGTDKKSVKTLMILAIILVVVLTIFYIFQLF